MSALDRVFRSRRPSQERPAAATVAGLWKNGEQGVWYDVESFRDSWSQVGPNLTPPTAAVFGEASVVSPGVYRIYSSSGAFSSVNSAAAVIGRRYVVSFNVDSITTLGSGLVIESAENPSITTIGPKSFLVTAVNTSLHVKRGAACDIQISGLSAKEWLGVDKCPLFQDAAGTLPCYLPGQGQVDPPVGLLLDKRLGLTRGAEVWSDAAAMLSGSASRVSAGVYRIYTPDGSIASVYHPVVSGRWYVVSFRVVSVAVASVGLYIGPSASNAVFPSNAMVPGRMLSAVLYANSGSLAIARNASTTDVTIDSVSVQEIHGNHAYQATPTSRPTLSARYNAFLASEKFDDAYWTWQASFTSQKTTEITDPSGGFDGWKITSNIANAALSRAGLTGFRNPVFTMVAKAGTWTPSIMIRNATTAVNMVNAPLTSGDFTNSYGKYSARDLGGGWKEMKIEITSGVAVTDTLIAYLGSTGAIPVGQYMYLLRADFRESGDGVGLPAYQRVVDANTYDTLGFPLHLRFDGVDDWLQTANVDFSGVTAVLAMAAVRKLSDASRGIVVELGASGYGQPGSFNIEMAWFSPNWSSSYSGATGSSTVTEPGIAAPASAVVGSYADQGAPSIQLRYQGKARAPSTAAVGGGGFLNAPVYIGRRGGSSSAANMRLYGLLVRGGPAADNQVAAVGKRLNQQARIY